MSVGSNMVAKDLPKWIWQVVDEGDITEDIALSKVKTVGLKREEAVRCINNNASAWLGNSISFSDRHRIVGYMLDYLMEKGDVEGVVWEREMFGGSSSQHLPLAIAFNEFLPIQIHAIDLSAEAEKCLNIDAHAAANVQDSFPFKP